MCVDIEEEKCVFVESKSENGCLSNSQVKWLARHPDQQVRVIFGANPIDDMCIFGSGNRVSVHKVVKEEVEKLELD